MTLRLKTLLNLGVCSCIGLFVSIPLAHAQLQSVDAALEAMENEQAPLQGDEDVSAAEENNDLQMLLPEDVPEEEAPILEIEQVETAPEQPAQADLNDPMPEPQADAAMDNQAAVMSPAQEFDEDLFFDAESLVPESDLARDAAPSKVNPTLNPGSRLVISTKKAGANSHEARFVAAERAMKLGRYESALAIYDQFLVHHKRNPNALLGRAVALQKLGRDDEAISAYDRLLDRKPDNLEAQINLQGLMAKRYPAVAARNLKDLYEQYPDNVAIISQLSVVEGMLGNFNSAIQYLGIAASMEPQNPSHLFNMAVIADRAGDRGQAIKYYEEALETDTLYTAGKGIPRESVFQRLAELR